MSKKLTAEEFIEKAKLIHANEYNYSFVEYNGAQKKIKIICLIHGEFKQTPNNHLNKHGCPKCGLERVINGQKYNNLLFINKAKKIHQNKYDYSLVNYIDSQTKIIIICPEHGNFEQKPFSHLRGTNCPNCAPNKKMNTDCFIKKANMTHNNKYNYSEVKYANSLTKINIICPKHGKFSQQPSAHLNGKGCPICKQSGGERKISRILDNNNVEYVVEKIFDACRYKMSLPFDFYLPKHNILIEYDGIQHFKAAKFYGGEYRFILRQKIDNIKIEFAKNNGIELIRIAYNENIEEKLITIV